MEKRRVYQVAKEQKLSSDALISMLKGMGHEVKSHMSVVTENMLKGNSSIEDIKLDSVISEEDGQMTSNIEITLIRN